MFITVYQVQRGRRTFIRVAATPKSAATRSLLRRFRKEVRTFEKRWKAAAAAARKKAARAGKSRRSRRRR
jgi:hypothetical protein